MEKDSKIHEGGKMQVVFQQIQGRKGKLEYLKLTIPR